MADNGLIRSSASKRDIYERLLNIAGKYTDMENTDYLKTGLFGYITESMAMSIRDSSLQKSMLYNESFLNTAIIPSSVYNWAKMFNIEVNKATPAYATINIIIDYNTLLGAIADNTTINYKKYGLAEGTKGLIIDKGDMIIAGSYYFSLEHSILIQEKSNNAEGSSGFTAKYILTEDTSTSFQDLKNSNLFVSYDGSNVIIEARAYQYYQRTITRQLSSSNYENKIQLFQFQDQFCGAQLYYEYNGVTDEVNLKYSNIISNISGEDKYAFYSLVNSNELQIKFNAASNNGFMPASNSKLILKLYTTKGTDIERSFSGDAIFRFADDRLKTLGIIVQFNPTDILGGQDIPSVDKIKQTIIKQLSLCNTIVTEADLNSYFETLTNLLESVNNGKVTFIKRRDDILKRTFNSYILLRDGLTDDNSAQAPTSYISKCVPTNTFSSVYGDATLLENSGSFLKVIYNSDTARYEVATSDSALENGYYFSPFYTYFNYYPVKKVRYIYPLTDNTSLVDIKSDTLVVGNQQYLTPIDINLYRGLAIDGAQPDTKYTVKVRFNTNLTKNELEVKNYTLKLSLINEFGTATLKDKTISDYKISYEIDENGNNTENVLILTFYINVNSNDAGTIKELQSNQTQLILADGYTLDSSYISLTLNAASTNNSEMTFVTNDLLVFYRSLDDIMTSELGIETDDNNLVTELLIKDLPVVHSSFLTDTSKTESVRDDFIKQLFTYITLLKENLGKLETSTFFNLKFYNTYGLSKFYNCQKTNLDVNLKIYINSGTYNNEQELKQLESEIRSYIRRAVDKSNESEEILMSSIISLIGRDDTYGKYIHHVEWNGLNGLFNQYIHKVSNINERSDAPEWLNIQKENWDSISFEVI